MNEIVKLKTEHARYKKALENILDGAPPCTLAEAALNPPPPPPVPVTMERLQELLRISTGHIEFFGDGSLVFYRNGFSNAYPNLKILVARLEAENY